MKKALAEFGMSLALSAAQWLAKHAEQAVEDKLSKMKEKKRNAK